MACSKTLSPAHHDYGTIQFTAGILAEVFSQNLEKVLAVSRATKAIGEAVKYIPDSARSHYPDVPWRDVAEMRDQLVHDYFNTDIEIA
ncbi:DUF86 domain-containing protein [Limnothrix sp. FACHB-708]|uniref:HepT-like ribonuclease domain-containing protein n=1 Tax=Limnothrix sp. FACHB-406 TaxID=2692817 RepID=UPI0016881B66|nr:DUF86 domain-containing protein [Limnothrix sp. FACHB-708]MBD2592447.1 DUF86 domain-containing protein [Limnothrix sp. FACHB-406]